MEKINYAELDFLGLMPCPLKIALDQVISEEVLRLKEADIPIHYKTVSNAVMQDNVFDDFRATDNIDELPDILFAPGISRFFYDDFVDKFVSKGYFQSIEAESSREYSEIGLNDPLGQYNIVGFNPLVFLYDGTKEPGLPKPKTWKDLTNPCYEGRIAYRGKDDHNFCEGVLLSVFKDMGDEGIRALGRSVHSRLHPAEMAKLAGTKKDEAPCISIIPLSFSRMVRKSSQVEIIWPEDGAAVNPLVMLVKKEADQRVRSFAEFLVGSQIQKIYEDIGFFMQGSDFSTFKEGSTFKWCGWDFLREHHAQRLIERLNAIMFDEIQKRRGA